MAPEIREGQTYDGKSADIFSLGVVLYTMIQGTHPFSQASKDESFYKLLIRRERKEFWERTHSSHLSDDLKDLLTRMLRYEPHRRPTITEVAAHPWMQEPLPSSKEISRLLQSVQDRNSDITTDLSHSC